MLLDFGWVGKAGIKTKPDIRPSYFHVKHCGIHGAFYEFGTPKSCWFKSNLPWLFWVTFSLWNPSCRITSRLHRLRDISCWSSCQQRRFFSETLTSWFFGHKKTYLKSTVLNSSTWIPRWSPTVPSPALLMIGACLTLWTLYRGWAARNCAKAKGIRCGACLIFSLGGAWRTNCCSFPSSLF